MASLIYEMKNEDEEVKREQASLTARTHNTTVSNVLSLKQQNLSGGNELEISLSYSSCCQGSSKTVLGSVVSTFGRIDLCSKIQIGEGELIYCASLLWLCVGGANSHI